MNAEDVTSTAKRTRYRRRALLIGAGVVLVVAVALVWVLSRSGGPPSVRFDSVAGTVQTDPTQYCDLRVTHCTNTPEVVATLAVPAGQPLRVQVPDEVAKTPWQVVFSYRRKDAPAVDARSPVFAPGKQDDYTLVLPDADDQLVTAQVQQYGGGTPTMDPSGDPSFPIRASWVLRTP